MTRPTSFHWSRPGSLIAFGAALRRQRESRGMTLDDLAAASATSKPYLSNIETARAPGPPSEEKLRRIARAIGLEPSQLLAGADWLRAPVSIRKALAALGDGGAPDAREIDEALPIDTLTRELQTAQRRPDGTIDLDQIMRARHPASTQAVATDRDAQTHVLPLRPVPLINRVAAGKAAEFTDMSYPAGVADQYVAAPDLPDAPLAAAFAVRVIGDSMTPEYAEGEILIVGPADGEGAERSGGGGAARWG